MSLVFDTLKLSKSLGRAFTPEQAEVLTEALTINVSEGLATKADLSVETADLKAAIAALRTELKTEIAGVRTEIAGVQTEVAELETRLTTRITAMEVTIANTRAELIRWIVTSFVGNVITMVTIAIAVAKFVAHP